MTTIYAVYLDPWEKMSEFYSSLDSAQKAMATIRAKYGFETLEIREFSVYDYNMEESN